MKRVQELVRDQFFTDIALFRSVPGFLLQFGQAVGESRWNTATIEDDHPSPRPRITRGTLSFAGGGTNSRTNQLFFAYCAGDACGQLGEQPWETSVGELVGDESFETLDRLERAHAYGDMPPWGQGPAPDKIAADADGSYLRRFPDLAYLKGCELLGELGGARAAAAAAEEPRTPHANHPASADEL